MKYFHVQLEMNRKYEQPDKPPDIQLICILYVAYKITLFGQLDIVTLTHLHVMSSLVIGWQ